MAIHSAGRLVHHEEYRTEIVQDNVDIRLTGAARLAAAFRPHLTRSCGCIIPD